MEVQRQQETTTLCPRCSGKGFIDTSDIQKFGKSNIWNEGVCFYCNGNKRVGSNISNNVMPNDDFLSIKRSEREREVYTKDPKSFLKLDALISNNSTDSDNDKLNVISYGIESKKMFLYDFKELAEISNWLRTKSLKQEQIDLIIEFLNRNNRSSRLASNQEIPDTSKPPYYVRFILAVVLVGLAITIGVSINSDAIIFRFLIGIPVIFLGKIIMNWGVD